MADVIMEDVDKAVEGDSEEKPATKEDKDVLTFEDVREQFKLIERSVLQKESRYMIRVVRYIPKIRKKLNCNILWKLICNCHPSGMSRDALIKFVDEPMEIEVGKTSPQKGRSATRAVLPEVDVYLHLLVMINLLDQEALEKARECSEELVTKIAILNRRSLDPLAAKCYFFHSRVNELLGTLGSLRNLFYSRLRTATLHHDEQTQAVLLNLLLRNYLHYNLYDQADKLVSKSTFPHNASNSEMARFLFYLGRIRAIQLDYSEAYKHLTQAIRKAPQHSAYGFRQTAHKFTIVVQLLLGEIPERAIYRERVLSMPLMPYFKLTQAVRNGDLDKFNEVVATYTDKFQQDDTYSLITRLRHNVIKTGIKLICLSYSRISLKDIAAKLLLDDALDAEYIVAKAIKDKVIEATLNHEEGYMQSKENIDIYGTREPQDAFNVRVQYCLNLYTQTVKAMRYPPKHYKENDELRDKEQVIDVIKLAEEDDDDELDMDDEMSGDYT